MPDLGVGDGSVIERAILDKDCRIGRNVRIVNQRGLKDDGGATTTSSATASSSSRAARSSPDGTVI